MKQFVKQKQKNSDSEIALPEWVRGGRKRRGGNIKFIIIQRTLR